MSIHDPYATLIATGQKTVELRSCGLGSKRLNRWIPVLNSTTGCVVAVVRFNRSELLNAQSYAAIAPLHQFPLPFAECTWRFAWFIESVIPLRAPVPVKRLQGAIGWVGCDEQHLAAISAQLWPP